MPESCNNEEYWPEGVVAVQAELSKVGCSYLEVMKNSTIHFISKFLV